MNKNVLGGAAAVLALTAILYLGTHRKPAVVTPAAPITTPAPLPPGITPDSVKPAPTKPTKKTVPLPTPRPVAKPPALPSPLPTSDFFRVGHGGVPGEKVQCSKVTPFAEGKTEAELAATAKQYGITVAQLKQNFICTP